MSAIGDACQSCGIPLEKEDLLGTNSDGSPSKSFCKHCYKDGIFTDEGISLDEKIDKTIEIAVKKGMSKDVAEAMVKGTLPKLQRWKKKD